MSFEITKTTAIIIISVLVLVVVITVFILPMMFNLFIGRGFCTFLGSYFLKLLLGDSVFLGLSAGGIGVACSVIPF